VTRSGILKWAGLAIVVILAIIVYRLLGGVIGEILAESDFFEPLTINSLAPPGFGGHI